MPQCGIGQEASTDWLVRSCSAKKMFAVMSGFSGARAGGNLGSRQPVEFDVVDKHGEPLVAVGEKLGENVVVGMPAARGDLPLSVYTCPSRGPP